MTITHKSQSHDATVCNRAEDDILEALEVLVQLNTDELIEPCDSVLIRYRDEETFAKYEPQLVADFGASAYLLYDCALEKIRFILQKQNADICTITMAPDEYENWRKARKLTDTPASRAIWASEHVRHLPVQAA